MKKMKMDTFKDEIVLPEDKIEVAQYLLDCRRRDCMKWTCGQANFLLNRKFKSSENRKQEDR
jgi:hypothetical protein